MIRESFKISTLPTILRNSILVLSLPIFRLQTSVVLGNLWAYPYAVRCRYFDCSKSIRDQET